MRKNKTIMRAWTNPVFRATLSAAERAALPASPAGESDLEIADLKSVRGMGVVTRNGNYGTASAGLCAPEGWDCGKPPI
jgi:mersacidin/lichenicidin family type 2 lantibiotic